MSIEEQRIVRMDPFTGQPREEVVRKEIKVERRGGGGSTTPSLRDTDSLPEGSINLYFTNERAQDAVGTILTDTATLDFTYNDAGNTVTGDVLNSPLLQGQNGSYYLSRANHTGTQAASTISDFSEAVDDRAAALIQDGANLAWTYNDSGNTLTGDVLQRYNYFVYNSGGSQSYPSGNRFNSWSTLMTHLADLEGAKTIQFEQNETIPAGSYNLDNVTLKGNGLEYNAGGYTVTFGDNTTISSWSNRIISDIRVLSTSTTGNICTDSNPTVINCTSISNVHSTTYPFFKFTGSGQYIVSLNNNARWGLLGGGVENVEVTSSAFACQLILSRGKGSSPENNTFKSTNAVIFIDVIGDASQDATRYPLSNSGLSVGFEVDVNQAYSTTQNHVPVSKNSNFTYTRAGEVYGVDASGGAVTGSLPPAKGLGVLFTTVKTDNSVNAVTVDADGSDVINSITAWSAANYSLPLRGNSVTMVDFASGVWLVVGAL